MLIMYLEEDKYEDDSCIAWNQNNQTINKTTLQQSKSSGTFNLLFY